MLSRVGDLGRVADHADAPARTFVGIQPREPGVTGTMYGYARTDDATRPFA
jgi:hypothetical protein